MPRPFRKGIACHPTTHMCPFCYHGICCFIIWYVHTPFTQFRSGTEIAGKFKVSCVKFSSKRRFFVKTRLGRLGQVLQRLGRVSSAKNGQWLGRAGSVRSFTIFNHATFFIDRYVSYIVNLEKGFSCPLFDNLRIIRNVFSKSLKYFANLFLGKCTTLFSKKSTIEA